MISVTMSLLFFSHYLAVMVFAQVVLLSPQSKHVLSLLQLFDMLSENAFVCQRRKRNVFPGAPVLDGSSLVSFVFLLKLNDSDL